MNTYLIATGTGIRESTRRRIIIVTPETCLVIEKYPNNELAIWCEGLTSEEGLKLVRAYEKSPSGIFGKLYRELLDKHICNGGSERGYYTRDEFVEYIKELNYGIEDYANEIYDIMWNTKCEVKILNKR